MAAHKVVMTTDFFSVAEDAERVFAGLDVDFVEARADGEDELLALTRDADGLLVLGEHITQNIIDGLQRCRVISRFGVGVDTVDVPAATRRDIWVTNVPDGNYREVAVQTIALALAASRRLIAFNSEMHRTGGAPHSIGAGMRRPDSQIFGLLGLGRIGGRVAEMARGIGFDVAAFDPAVSAQDAASRGARLVDFDELVATSDILSVHVPLMDATRNIIDDEVISRMPAGAILLNCSRGGLVDEAALARAVHEGRLQAAGIDAYVGEPAAMRSDNPLLSDPRIILTPHSAALSVEAMAEITRKALENIAAVLRGGTPAYPVNALARHSQAPA